MSKNENFHPHYKVIQIKKDLRVLFFGMINVPHSRKTKHTNTHWQHCPCSYKTICIKKKKNLFLSVHGPNDQHWISIVSVMAVSLSVASKLIKQGSWQGRVERRPAVLLNFRYSSEHLAPSQQGHLGRERGVSIGFHHFFMLNTPSWAPAQTWDCSDYLVWYF